MHNRVTRGFFVRVMYLCALALTPSAAAQITSNWQQPGSGLWNDPASWSAGVPMAAGDQAVFGPAIPTADAFIFVSDPATTIGTLTYDNPYEIRLVALGLAFDGNGGAAMIDILNGGVVFDTGSFTLNTDLDLSVAPGTNATVGIGFTPAASLSGAGGLNVLGGGEVVFSGANSYDGATHIQNGTLRIFTNDSLGIGTGIDADGTFIHIGGTLEIAGDSTTLPNEKIVLDGGTLAGNDWFIDAPVQMDGGLITGADWTVTGPVTTSGGQISGSNWSVAGEITLDGILSANGTGRIDGAIHGGGGIDIGPSSIVRMYGTNSYSGHTSVTGSLTAGSDESLGSGTGTDADGTTIYAGGNLVLSNADLVNEKIDLIGGTISGFGSVGGPVHLDGGLITGRGTFNGPIEVGSGTMGGNILVNGPVVLNGPVEFDAGTELVNEGTVINGDISGAGDVLVTGVVGDSVHLYGDNTFAGRVTIDSGRLAVHHPNGLGAAANDVVVDGGVLELFSAESRPLELDSGSILLSDAIQPHTNPIVMTSGELSSGLDKKYVTHEGTVTFVGPGPKRISGDYGLYMNGEISGSGPLTLGGRLVLQSPNTYTGLTTISADRVDISAPNALGDTVNGTVVADGVLVIGVGNVAEAIRVEGGSVVLGTDTHSGEVTLAGGEITTSSFLGGVPRAITSPLIIDGAGTLTTNDEDLILDGGITGKGLVRFYDTNDTFILNGPYDYSGEMIFSDARDLEVNTPMTVSGKVWFDQGTVVANEDVVLAGGLRSIHGGRLVTAPGKTITIPVDELQIGNMGLDADLVGPTTLTLDSREGASLTRLSPSFDGDINVINGHLTVYDGAGLGSSVGATYVRSNENAAVLLAEGVTVTDDIYLNNSTGYAHTGALLVWRNDATVEGGIDLGDIGSYVGNREGNMSTTRLYLAGPISGGSLTKVGLGRTYITGNANTYTGDTILKENSLHLIDEGTLTTTSGIRIEGKYSEFIIDNTGTQNLSDRIADHIPFELAGGTLALSAKENTTATETIGHVAVHSGHTLVRAVQESYSESILTISSMSRNPGASIDFQSWPGHGREVRFVTPPTLDDGLLGGWATVTTNEGTNFASYANGAVLALSTGLPDINTAGPTDNVRLRDPAVLSDDRTINSLWMSDDVTELDLDGHTLTIDSGGVLVPDGVSIANGQITASADVGELILHGVVGLNADIVDPPDGSIGLTSAGGLYNRHGLTGHNTYTGPTVVNTNTLLRIYQSQSVPVNNDVKVMGGSYRIILPTEEVIDLGNVILDGDGYFGEVTSSALIDADSYEFRWGTATHDLVGDGIMTKTSPNTVTLNGNNDQFTGSIVIDEGILIAEEYGALGDGPVTVNPGGRLKIDWGDASVSTGPITLDGGELHMFIDPAEVVCDVTVLTDSAAAGTLNVNLIGDADLYISKSTVGDLALVGDNSAFTGNIIADGSELSFLETSAFIQGLIDVRNNSQLILHTSAIPVRARIEDSSLTIYQPYPRDLRYVLNGEFTFAGDSIVAQFDDSMLAGIVTLESGTVLRKRNQGTWTFDADVLVGENTRVVVHEGVLQFGGTLKSNAPEASIDLVSANAALITGSVYVEHGQSLTITVNGESEPLYIDTTDQIVSGSGILGNDLVLSGGASMMPGSSAGTFTVDGDYTQLLNAIMQIELGGTSPGTYDRLIVTGMLDAGGVFEVTLLDGFVPQPGDVFDVLDFGTLVPGSAFDQIVLPELTLGGDWDTSDLLVTGEVRVVPEPAGVFGLGLSLLLLRRRGQRPIAA
jgi:autotransporter-associated beta strand protein